MHLYGRLFQTVEELKRMQNRGEVFITIISYISLITNAYIILSITH
jgi:hypothetical protein